METYGEVDQASASEPVSPGRQRRGSRLGIGAVRVYQHARGGKPSGCRWWPSCSEYCVEALEMHGLWLGALLSVHRLTRCGPWGGHGFDPVPPACTELRRVTVERGVG
jgi:putative membrane protein insertion efficiency factor